MPIKSVRFIEKLQPQCAAFVAFATDIRGAAPAAGDSLLMIDFGSTLDGEKELAEFLDNRWVTDAASIHRQRSGSIIVLSGNDTDALRSIAENLASEAGVEVLGAAETKVCDSLLLEDISVEYAAMSNRAQSGTMLLPGDCLLLVDCDPPAQVACLANFLESEHPGIYLIDFDERGGRLRVKGNRGLMRSVISAMARDSGASSSRPRH